MKHLLDVFPFIKKTMLELEQQNKFLNKVTLTGKINALNVAANLFEFTDKTAIIFDELKIELVDALLEENINKVTNELTFKAKTTIDILIRNLFERTADVGFLSTDSVIIEFLTSNKISKKEVQTHLDEYVKKYSVYNEIVIFDTNANAIVNLNPQNNIIKSNDTIIQDALDSDEYIERYAHSDIFKEQKKTLIYAQKITHNSQKIGVLCLCFKFEDELNSIFTNLSQNDEILAVSDKSTILATNNSTINKLKSSYTEENYKIIDKKFIYVSKKTTGYQGYFGIKEWYAIAIKNASTIKENVSNDEDRNHSSNNKNLLNENLNQIIEKANDIIEDIADVIINGELIASKQKVYVLTPILDNLRNISTELLSSIKDSIKNLEHIVKEGLIHDVEMASHLAVDIMDRNLYERANDSRWWALTPEFKNELTLENPDTHKLHSTLLYINELYTVYTNIFIYNKERKIIAASHDESIVGTILNDEYIHKTLSNRDSQNYYVSTFKESPLYDNNATYIYSASITNNEKVVGGIGVVFDAKPEFQAMLDDSFPESKKGFMLFVDENRQIISSNNPSLKVLEKLEIDEKFVNFKDTHSIYDFITLNEVDYIVSSVFSQGYREYKKEDNYTNSIYCLTFIEITSL